MNIEDINSIVIPENIIIEQINEEVLKIESTDNTSLNEVLKENDSEEVLKENDSEEVLKENNSEEVLKENDSKEVLKEENINKEEIQQETYEIDEEKKSLQFENAIIIFDLDGTLCKSSFEIEDKMVNILQKIKNKYNCELAINGGGTYEKICKQIGNAKSLFRYIFAECGSVVYDNDKLIQKNNLTNHKSYSMIQKLIRHSMKFISETSYDIGGHMIDVRNGLVYISMVGMQANENQRELFMKMDKRMEFRKRLLIQLNEKKDKMMINQTKNLDLSIKYGGQVGISIFPLEWDKVQCLKHCKNYKNIHYFGDRYQEDGNDYLIINHEKVIGHKINNIEETYNELEQILFYE